MKEKMRVATLCLSLLMILSIFSTSVLAVDREEVDKVNKKVKNAQRVTDARTKRKNSTVDRSSEKNIDEKRELKKRDEC